MPVARPPRPTRSLAARRSPAVVGRRRRGPDARPPRDARRRRCCAASTTSLFTPHADTGDFVVIVNAEQVRLTGRKREQKIYYRHTGYVGHLEVAARPTRCSSGAHPERVIETAVRGMLPKNSLGRKLYRKLKVYAGPNHPHAAQQPQELTLG